MLSRIDAAAESGKLELLWISYGVHPKTAHDMAWNYYFFRVCGSNLMDEAARVADEVMGRRGHGNRS